MANNVEWGWLVPVAGDGDHVGTYFPEAPPTIDHLKEVIQTAEEAGFHTVLIPTSLVNNDFSQYSPRMETIVVTSALAMATSRIKLLMAVKIGEVHPPLLAKMAATLDQISNGRLVLNITSGSGSYEPRYGETLDHDARYERTWETITLMRMLWTQERTTFQGKYCSVYDVVAEPKPVQKPHVPLYMVGMSEIAREMSAAEGEVHLMQGDTPEKLSREASDIQRRAEKLGRSLRFGIRLQVVTRPTQAEALEALREMMSKVDPRIRAARKEGYASSDSVEHTALVEKALGTDWLGPNLWGGMHAVKSGAGTILVGSHQQVADRLVGYIEAGITTFILSSYPMAREARRVGENVIPLVEQRVKAYV